MSKTGQGITRRSFLATTSLAVGGLALASAAGCSSVSTSSQAASASSASQSSGASSDVFYGTCRGNCGGVCVLEAKVRDDKIVSTFPVVFPADEPGREQGCVKGQSNVLRIYGTHRILHPMKATGGRGSGQWEQITWDEAYKILAEKFENAAKEYGPKSVCMTSGFGAVVGVLDGCTNQSLSLKNKTYAPTRGLGQALFQHKIGATCLISGADHAWMHFKNSILNLASNSNEDLPNAKTIIEWGANPAEASFSRSSWYWACVAREGGTKIITIDPQYTPTAAQSDQWVPVRVGSDAVLACAMSNYIIENQLFDEEFLVTQTIAPFLIKNDGGAYVRLNDLPGNEGKYADEENVPVVLDSDSGEFVSFKDAKKPAYTGVADVNGVAVKTAFDAARENIAAYTVEYAAGECGIPAETIENLARTCAVDTPTTYNIYYGVEHSMESWRVALSVAFLGALTGSTNAPGAACSVFIYNATMAFKEPPKLDLSCFTPEEKSDIDVYTLEHLPSIVRTGKWGDTDFPIRALYIAGCNPIDNSAGATDIIEAFNNIDFICTADCFMTTTAHYSDLVLPVTMPWEAEDFMTRPNMGHLMQQKAIEPLGEARPDFDIFKGLAEVMGFDDLYTKTREEYLREVLDTDENKQAGLDYDAFHKNGAFPRDYEITVTQAKESNEFERLRFYMEELKPLDDYGQTFEFGDRLPSYAHAAEAYLDNPDRARYPLFGMSSHDNYHGQTLWAHNAWLDYFRTVDGKPYCRIHETAAAERGIQTGDKVRIFNDHGSVVLNALVTKGIREDTVAVPHGFFWDEFDEGFAQSLTGNYVDKISSNSCYNDWICQVEKA